MAVTAIVKSRIKESVKDIVYQNRIRNSQQFDFYYIHPTKTGGTYLKNVLMESPISVYANAHELKSYHAPRNSSLLISVRDPIKRFESSYYSLLHKRKNLEDRNRKKTKRWKQFYTQYPNINYYIESLRSDWQKTIHNSYILNDHVGRFSTYGYWIKNISYIRSINSHKLYIFRVEKLDNDIERFFKFVNIDKPELKEHKRYSNTYSLIEKIKEENVEFLKVYLEGEYKLANTLLEIKDLPKYNR